MPNEDVTSIYNPSNAFDDLLSIQKEINGMIKKDEKKFQLPPSEIVEDERQFAVHIDLPGIEQNQIKVNFKEHDLVISAERREGFHKTTDKKSISEIYYGSYYRVIPLTPKVLKDKIKANYHNGVLEVIIPKAPPPEPEAIPVPIEGNQDQSRYGDQIPIL